MNLLHALMSFVLPYTGHGEATVCLVCSMLESMTQCLGNGPPGSPNAVCSKLQCIGRLLYLNMHGWMSIAIL